MALSAAMVLARKYGLPGDDVELASAMSTNAAAKFLGVSKKTAGVIVGSGSFKMSLGFDAGGSGYVDGFVFTWTRADKPKLRTVIISAGETPSVTVTGVPAGVSCRVVSVTPESAAPTDWHWGATTFTPEDREVPVVETGEGGVAEVTAVPTIVADPGSLKISKVLVDGDESGETGPFTITYTVDGGDPVEVALDAGDDVTVGGLPAGATVVVAEDKPTPDPEGFEWSDPVLDPVDGEVVVVSNVVGEVEVTNTIAASA